MEKDEEDCHEERKNEVLQKMQKARQNIILEILATEESYVYDLKTCVDVFFQPEEEKKFQEAKIDVYMLFSNFKEIYELSQKLLDLLYKRVKHVNFSEQNVGQCFLEMTEEMKMVYSEYCATSDGAMMYLEKNHQNPFLLEKTNELMLLHENTNKSVSLLSMLMKPVQRITKYPLLLSELFKATEESHLDFQPLVEANEAIKKVVNIVNESKRTRELVTKYRKRNESSLWDKFSHLNRHSFQKKLNRARGYLAVNSGFYAQIKDEVFERKLNEFTSVKNAVETLWDNLCKYVETFEETMVTFCNLASDIKELYGDAAFGSLFVSSLLELSRLVMTSFSPSVKTVIESAVIEPLSTLIKCYEGPVALINKRWDKLMEIQGDEKLDLVRKEYEALNRQLIKELPMLCKMSVEVVLNCVIVFNFVKETFLSEWKRHLDEVLKLVEPENQSNQRLKAANTILSSLRFHQSLDDKYSIGLLANVLMNVPVLNPLGFSDRQFRHSLPPFQRPKSVVEKGRASMTLPGSGPEPESPGSQKENCCFPNGSNPSTQRNICSIKITPPIEEEEEDDGFYYAKSPYYARANQYEVSLYDGQFVTVIEKKDGNNNHDWWQVFTDDHHFGYCPAICLEKAENFMNSTQLPTLTELDHYSNT